ncbi:MAG: HEAT repeat domain-containing protein [Candidatus Dormibacteraeota bacterium]|nr:HEAT repeat domain-containing protein [Candidatus Dormibacteraeota bacterium]
MAVWDGKTKVDFGPAHPTDISDALIAAMSAFGGRYPDEFFDAAAKRPRDSGIAWALQSLIEPRSREYLMDALSSEGWPARWAAVIGLGRQGDQAVVPDLYRLLNDPDRLVRNSVIESLGLLADPRAIEPLRNFANNPPADATAEDIDKAAQVVLRLVRSGRVKVGQAPDALAGRIIGDLRRWASEDDTLPAFGKGEPNDVRFARDEDLVWTETGPTIEENKLFRAGENPWSRLFDGGSPWVNACAMVTTDGELIVALTVQSRANRSPHEHRFAEMALSLSFEKRRLVYR